MTMIIDREKWLALELWVKELVSKLQSIFEPLHLLKRSPHRALTDTLISRFLKVHCLLHVLLPVTYPLLPEFIILFFHYYSSHSWSPYSFETSYVLINCYTKFTD